VDLIEVLQFVGLRIEIFTVGQTIIKVVSSKVAKHDKICSDNQRTFILFAFDIF
jgi:hypothetical protein